MHAQVGDVETKAQTGMSVLQVVVAEMFPGPGSHLPLKRGVQIWGGFSGVFLSSVSGPLHPLSAACSGASLSAVGSSSTLSWATFTPDPVTFCVFAASAPCSKVSGVFVPILHWLSLSTCTSLSYLEEQQWQQHMKSPLYLPSLSNSFLNSLLHKIPDHA